MKKGLVLTAMLGLVLAFGLALTGCGDSGSGDPTSGGGDQTGGGDDNTGSGKVTITLLAGSGTGNIRLKLSEGTWNTSGSWDATQSSNLNSIMNSLLTTYSSGGIAGAQCTATIIENDTALNIELKNSSGLLEISGEVHVKTTLNPVTFPYTSHGGVSLSDKFQAAGSPVSFVNKTRLYADTSTPWKSSSRQIIISGSQIDFYDISSGSSHYFYTYNIDTWKSDYVGGDYCVTIDVSNGRKTEGLYSPPSCITGKTSFTFKFESWNSSLSIKQANGTTFSGTDGWDKSFTK
jgi:hypothetical protein